MNATEIVVREMQSDSGFQVRQFLAESIREPRKSPHRHSHRQVLPFNKRSADMFGIGITSSDLGYNPRDAWWGIPRFGSVELPVVAKHFGKLGEIRVQAKAHRNCTPVVMQPVSRDLRPAFDAVIQIPQELGGVTAKTLPDVKRRNQLGFRVNRHKHPLASKLFGIARANTFLFLANPRPDFIDFQVSGLESTHSSVHQFGTALSRHDEKAHDGIAIKPREPFRTADRAAFEKAMQRTHCRVRVRDEHISREFCVGFGKAGIARSAFPALNAFLTEVTELLAGLVLAFYARHGLFSACVLREKPYNRFGSGLRLTPRFGLAPQPVSAGSGADIVSYFLGWWLNRDNYGLTVSKANLNPESHADSILSESPVLAGLSLLKPQSLSLFPHRGRGDRRSRNIRRSLSVECRNTSELVVVRPIGESIVAGNGTPHPAIHIPTVDIARGLNLALLVKARYDGLDRSQEISPSAPVAHALHLFSHVMRGHLAPRGSERHADRVGQSESILLNKLGFTAQDLQGSNGLPKFNDGLFSLFCGILCFAQNLNLFCEISFSLFQSLLVSVCSHIV